MSESSQRPASRTPRRAVGCGSGSTGLAPSKGTARGSGVDRWHDCGIAASAARARRRCGERSRFPMIEAVGAPMIVQQCPMTDRSHPPIIELHRGSPRPAPGCPLSDLRDKLRRVGPAADAPARVARLAPVRQGRPPSHGRDAVRGSARGRGCRSRWRPSTTPCTSSPKPACCAQLAVDGAKPISTPTRPSTTISSSRTRRADRHAGRRHRRRRPAAAADGMEIARVDVIVRLRRKASDDGPSAGRRR